MIVYKVTNIKNNKVYIGQTIRNLESRKRQHLLYATNEKYYSRFNCKFYEAIRKYGKENFEWEDVCQCNTIEDLNEKEKLFIKEYDSFGDNGYNLTNGGLNFIRSEETKEKYKQARRNRVTSEETRKKLSEARKGKKFTEEHKKNLSLSQKGKERPWQKGRKISEETKKKMSLAQIGNKKMVGKTPWNKGLKISEKTREKIKISCKGINSKKVDRFDLNWNYIDTWNSITEF